MYSKIAAEFIGTFWLVLGGCGSAVLAAAYPQLGIGFAGVALAFGLTVLTGVYAFGPISGGHFNPARSTGPAVFVGGWAIGQLWFFWVFPIIGGVIAGLVYRNLFEAAEIEPPIVGRATRA